MGTVGRGVPRHRGGATVVEADLAALPLGVGVLPGVGSRPEGEPEDRGRHARRGPDETRPQAAEDRADDGTLADYLEQGDHPDDGESPGERGK